MAVIHVTQCTERIVSWFDVVAPDTPVEPTEHEEMQTTEPPA